MVAVDDIIERHRSSQEGATGTSAVDKGIDWSAMELYVSCEPCIMCAAALSQLGLTDIYYGCANDKFGGCGSIVDLCSRGSGGCNGCVRIVRSCFTTDDDHVHSCTALNHCGANIAQT